VNSKDRSADVPKHAQNYFTMRQSWMH